MMITKSTTFLTSLFLGLVMLGAAPANARLTKEQYVAKCMQLATTSGRSGPTFTCTANSLKDADLLRSIGLDDSFEVEAEDAKVGSWGDRDSKFYGVVYFVVKWGIFGGKAMSINCMETRQGNVEYNTKYNSINVQIQNRIDDSVDAKVTCK